MKISAFNAYKTEFRAVIRKVLAEDPTVFDQRK